MLIELPTPAQFYRCELLPRLGKQQSTHTLTHYYLEGSLDNSIYTKIFESKLVVDQNRSFDFPITIKHKYLKLTCTGKQQFGLSKIRLYEAELEATDLSSLPVISPNPDNQAGQLVLLGTDVKPTFYKTPINITATGQITFLRAVVVEIQSLFKDLNMSTNNITNVKALYSDEVKTKLIYCTHVDADKLYATDLIIEAGSQYEMRIGNRQITGVIAPTQSHEVANKIYVDDVETRLKVYADELHRRAMLSYSGTNLQTNDKIISTSIYNTIGTYSNGN